MNHLVALGLLWLPVPEIPSAYAQLPRLEWCETALAACDADLAWLDARIPHEGDGERSSSPRSAATWSAWGGTMDNDEAALLLCDLIGAEAFERGELPVPLGLGR